MTFTKFSRKRIGQALGLLVLVLSLLTSGAIATVGDHPDSETPGSQEAVIFSPHGWGNEFAQIALISVKEALEDHDYKVTLYVDETEASDDDPQGATVTNFREALSQKGVVYILTHGGQDSIHGPILLVESYKSKDAREAAYKKYGFKETDGTFDACDNFKDSNGNQIYGLCVTPEGVKKYFKDNETIVHVDACSSFNFVKDFNAREYFGYKETAKCGRDVFENTTLLWGRMHGSKDEGKKRAARVAYEAGGFSEGFAYKHKDGKLDTVLSPAVKQHRPPKNAEFVVPVNVEGKVIFDTRMDTRVNPAAVITVAGCDARILNPTWTSAFILDFALELNTEGEATLTVRQEAAQAERQFKNKLDGNTRWRDERGDIQENPEGGEDHIGPNRDDFVWKVKCVKKSRTSFSFTVPVGTGGSCKAKTPELGSIQISEIWATVTNCKTGQPLPQGTPVTFTVNLKPGKEKAEHISDIESITVSAPDFEATTVQGPFTAIKVSIPGPSPITIQVINLGTVCLKPK